MSEHHFADASAIWERAITLAERGRGLTSPNPCVGAVLTRDGRLVGEGWHHRHGSLHAEREALADARNRGEDPRGATAWVTLEPCAHQGTQPPCSTALVEAGVERVVIGCGDPSPKTSGRGPAELERAGIKVEWATGEAADRCRELVQDFLKPLETGRPLVTLKLAMSLDGRVATRTGDSQWITGPEARAIVHRWRAGTDAVAVGSGTVAADNPRLTARADEHPDLAALGELRQPARVIFDSGPVLRPDAALFEAIDEAPVIVVTGPQADRDRLRELERVGAETVITGAGSPADRFREALDRLGERGIRSLLLEGGPSLAAVALAAGEVDRVEIFVAPLILGGGRPAVDGDGPELVSDAVRTGRLRTGPVGQDVLMSATVRVW